MATRPFVGGCSVFFGKQPVYIPFGAVFLGTRMIVSGATIAMCSC